MPRLRHLLILVFGLSFAATAFADHHEKQFIELRYFHLKSADSAKAVDEYLVNAFLPALNRAGSETVGLFKEETEQAEPYRLVVFAHDSIEAFAGLGEKLASDETYQKAAADYMHTSPKEAPLARVRSELLNSFDCWPKLKVPAETKLDGRIFEVRIYESSNQRFGDLKVEMFNAGEVPIFLDSGVMPVFMGQAIAGDKMPNLTYMTVYKDQATKDQSWKNFSKHADWQVLKEVEKYKGTVSKIHKLDLVPMAGSQL